MALRFYHVKFFYKAVYKKISWQLYNHFTNALLKGYSYLNVGNYSIESSPRIKTY